MRKLDKGKGFGMNYRYPRKDMTAYVACKKEFGDRVDEIVDKHERTPLDYTTLIGDLLEYRCETAPRIQDDGLYSCILESVRRDFTPDEKLIPLTMGAAAAHPDLPRQKSPGLPYKLDPRGYRTKGEVFNDPKELARINRNWHLRGHSNHPPRLPDVCLFARAPITQVGKPKIRATWGYPAEAFLEEARFFYPYMDWIKTSAKTPIAYGLEMSTGGMTAINNMARFFQGQRFVMLDWKRFDKHIPAWIIRDAFKILYECFADDKVLDSEGKIWKVRPRLTHKRWQAMVRYFINTPIRSSKGDRWMKDHGVPSGSAWTNILDTIVNVIVTRYLMYDVSGKLPSFDVYQGDDGFVILDSEELNLEVYAQIAHERFGMVLNTEKSYLTTNPDNIMFLGYYNKDGRPWRSQDFLIASACLPERPVYEEIDSLARCVGQMWTTLDPSWAVRWYNVCTEISEYIGISLDDGLNYMRTHAHQLKYLSTIGIDPTELVSVRPQYDGLIWDVRPKDAPRKAVKPFGHSIDVLWQEIKWEAYESALNMGQEYESCYELYHQRYKVPLEQEEDDPSLAAALAAEYEARDMLA